MSYSVRSNLSPFFTSGRAYGKVNKIIIHHAATTYFDGIGQTFKSRGVSAHYGVGTKKNVDKYVDEGNIAYHAGNWDANTRSIGIENVNISGAPNWSVADATFNTLVELVYDIAKRHDLLPLKVGSNLFGHKDFSATACPFALYPRLQALANAVNKKTGSSTSKPSKGKKSVSTLAREVIEGKWGNMPQRKTNLEKSGYSYSAVQAEVNRQLSGKSSAPKKKSVTTIAREVIAGAWGTGEARKSRLKKAGYDYNAVQSKVNQLLGVGAKRAVPSGGVIAVGQRVQAIKNVSYDGKSLGLSGTYTVMEVRGARIVIGRGGVVTAAMNKNNLRKV